jgi:hypothetical protein
MDADFFRVFRVFGGYIPLPVAWPAFAASLPVIVESMKPRLPNQAVERTAAVAGITGVGSFMAYVLRLHVLSAAVAHFGR